MSKAYQFPQDQPNPFAEPSAPAPTGGDNPYLASSADAYQAAPAAPAYQQTLRPRAGALTLWSFVALLLSVLAVAMAYYLLPLGLLALIVGIPTWLTTRSDLKAMQVGAMESAARGQLKAAHRLAIASNIISVLSLGAVAALIVRALVGA
jgi:hypothetical protein